MRPEARTFNKKKQIDNDSNGLLLSQQKQTELKMNTKREKRELQ